MRFSGTMRKLLVAGALLVAPAASFAGVFISVGFAPPALPVYTQPVAPGDGYLWTPGYWAYGPAGYYWVPGVWVRPPQVGVLWTPGYWGWGGGAYIFHAGYWGPHVGFYGGVNYGFGYGGVGFEGGYWHGGVFAYNRSVSNVNDMFTNVYNKTVVVNNVSVNRVSLTAGPAGLQAQASRRSRRRFASSMWRRRASRRLICRLRLPTGASLASVNGGRPQMAAARTAGEYHSVAQQHAASQPITERDRAANQQQRIGKGVKSGQLTPHETREPRRTARRASITRQTLTVRRMAAS